MNRCLEHYLHYCDVIMSPTAFQITRFTIAYSIVYSGTDQRNIKAPRHWPLCGEFTGDRWIPSQMASNAENVSIWWRHHGTNVGLFVTGNGKFQWYLNQNTTIFIQENEFENVSKISAILCRFQNVQIHHIVSLLYVNRESVPNNSTFCDKWPFLYPTELRVCIFTVH